MESEDKPCCAAAAARRIKQIRVGMQMVGIAGLDEILQEVRDLGSEPAAIADEIMARVGRKNFVPSTLRSEYREALLQEYLRRYPDPP